MPHKLRRRLGNLLNSLLGVFNLEIHRKVSAAPTEHADQRHTLRGALEHIKRLGFSPKSIFDVGAAMGTTSLYEVFPDSKHLLIEPLEENRSYLERIVRELPDAEYIKAVATASAGTVVLHVHPDLLGSSLYLEEEDSEVNGTPRNVACVSLDQIAEDRRCSAPYLIKLDVQGGELEALRGAGEVLKSTEYIVLEASLFGFFKGGPQIDEVFRFMTERGFVLYEALDYNYRPLDGAMSQMDLAFVKSEGIFRQQHCYATREQRLQHTKGLLASYHSGCID